MPVASIRPFGRRALPRLGALTALLLLSACAQSQFGRGAVRTDACASPAPAIAAANRLDTLAFCDDFASSGTIDSSATGKPGYNWYPQNFFGAETTRSSDYRVQSSVLSLIDQPISGGIGLQTAGPLQYSPPRYVGTTFVAPFYVEIRFAVSKAAAPGSQGFAGCGGGRPVLRFAWPTLWMEDVDLLFHQSTRTDPPVAKSEIDGIEFYVGCDGLGSGNWQIQMNIHEWSGYRKIANDAVNTPDLDAIRFDNSTFHTIAWLVKTTETGGGAGSVTWYFDGIQVAQVTWLPGAAFSSVETSKFDLIVNPGFRTWPIFVDYVQVWR